MYFFSCFRVFEDGIDWGRVAVVMYIAYLIILKGAKEKADSQPPFRKFVVSHVVRFIKEKLARWIASQSGWVSKRCGVVTSH